MKIEAPLITLPEIKRMLRLRLLCLLASIFFIVLTAAFSFGQQVTHWHWAGAFPIAGVCGLFALASSFGYLLLNKKLATLGL